MNITNAKYQAQYGENISILLTVGGEERPMTVPLDPANRHYQAILEWVEDGNTIEEAV